MHDGCTVTVVQKFHSADWSMDGVVSTGKGWRRARVTDAYQAFMQYRGVLNIRPSHKVLN